MKKKVLALVLCIALVAALTIGLVACNNSDNADLTVGVILIGDETEGYSEAHMNGINAAVNAIKETENKTVKIIWKKSIPETEACATAANELVSAGAKLVVTNSYGHQFQISDVIAANPSVTFISMTGDLAASSGKTNWKNAFTNIYEARYVSGVVAGLKLQELVNANPAKLSANNYDANNKIKIGYVGAYNYAEVVSGYTAFFLGMKSVVGDTIAMHVQYTNSWFDFNAEQETAKALIAEGCVIIGQHADSTGAPTACEAALKEGKVVYSVGYNVDMLTAAPHAALTSSTNNWEVYYEYAFKNMLNGGTIDTNWSKGYEANAVGTTKLGPACADGTQAAIDAAIVSIKAGTLKVFDCAKFTKGGENLTSYKDAYGMNNEECILGDEGAKYFSESTLRSAPYFDIRIDGITESGALE